MNVLENILKQIDELKQNYWCDSKERKDGAMDMSNIIKDIIKQHLQSAEDNKVLAGDWVPCSVRMPDKPDEFYGDKGYIVQVEEILEPFSAYWDGEKFTDDEDNIVKYVIAWKPLPEPYKPDQESADGKRQREREEFFNEYKDGE